MGLVSGPLQLRVQSRWSKRVENRRLYRVFFVRFISDVLETLVTVIPEQEIQKL